MKRIFNGSLVLSLLLCRGLLASDAPPKKSLAVAITFPAAGFYYSANVWNRGCGNTAGDICGTAASANGSIAKVEVSVKRQSGASIQYWDGVAFDNDKEVFIAADGTTRWNLDFGFDRFQPGVYTLRARATDSAGQTESGSIRIFSVSPDYTVIPVIASMEVIGKGSHPDFRKIPLTMDLKVFDKAAFQTGNEGAVEALTYGNIWERITTRMPSVPSASQLMNAEDASPPVASPNCEDSDTLDCTVRIQYGNVDAFFYEIMVPSDTIANRAAFGMSGSFLVIGKSMVCLNGSESSDAGSWRSCTATGGVETPVYTGTNLYSIQSGSLLTEKHLNVTVDGNGRIHSMRSRPIEGTALVISVPAYLDFTDTRESIPIVYESIGGDWRAKINIAPPKGFTVDTPGVELQGGGDTDVVQVTVSGSSAGSTRTGLTHTITHQGKTIDFQMYLEGVMGTDPSFP